MVHVSNPPPPTPPLPMDVDINHIHNDDFCSGFLGVFANGVMGRRINTSWWTHCAVSRSSQCSTTGVTKAVGCYPVCGMMHIKEPLLLIEKSSACSGDCRFPLSLSECFFTICMTPYNSK